MEEYSKGYIWSRRRRHDHIWPEVLTQIGKAAQNREKQEWAKEKPKLDNARNIRGIYFIDPDDEGYKEILKNARRNLERLVAAAMPCKRKAQTSTTKMVAKQEIAPGKIPKRFVAEWWNLMNPQGKEWNLLNPQNMKIALQAKVLLPMTHENLVTSLFVDNAPACTHISRACMTFQ